MDGDAPSRAALSAGPAINLAVTAELLGRIDGLAAARGARRDQMIRHLLETALDREETATHKAGRGAGTACPAGMTAGPGGVGPLAMDARSAGAQC